MPASVGVTGARGVLGRRIVDALVESGAQVSAFPGDVRDIGQIESWMHDQSFDTVVHSAAVVPVRVVQSDLGTAVAVNAGGTANLAAACAASGTRLVYVSTAHVYAPASGVLDESAEVAPLSLYGLTKLQGEEWCRRLTPQSLILRVFSFFDDRQSDEFMVPSLHRRIISAPPGSQLTVHGLTSTRDLASAEWLGGVIGLAALSDATGTVNCGTGVGSTVGQVAEIIRVVTGREDVGLGPADQDQPTALVADTGRLRQVLPQLRRFDLPQSLTDYVHARSL